MTTLKPSSILAGRQHGTLRGFIPHHTSGRSALRAADRKGESGAFDIYAAEDLWWRKYVRLLHVVPSTGLPMHDRSNEQVGRQVAIHAR
ncbi:hypothetical protein [Streptomyces sp. NPDC048350]|uniref:hypothetical protein n=1 Tax=Streptomyces sp. NPDC048350 TaxID=3365538 RepID=UPI003723A742